MRGRERPGYTGKTVREAERDLATQVRLYERQRETWLHR